jgi:hypothetical protein
VRVAADLMRLLAVGAIGLLAVLGEPEPWHVAALAFADGAGEAFFQPAFGAIVPAVVPGRELVQANALHTFLRPLTLGFAGPPLGGLLVAVLGPGRGCGRRLWPPPRRCWPSSARSRCCSPPSSAATWTATPATTAWCSRRWGRGDAGIGGDVAA